MNLNNTKVYTNDPEVIRKYAELCGKDVSNGVSLLTGDEVIGVCNSEAPFADTKFVNRFGASAHCHVHSWHKGITPDQINALYDEKFGKVETPEEAEAFESMAKKLGWIPNHEMSDLHPVIDVDGKLYTADDVRALLSLQDVKAEWSGEGLPPVGVECEVYGALGKYNEWHKCKVFAYEHGITFVSNGKIWRGIAKGEFDFRKPETLEQREKRERDEWVQSVIGEMMDSTGLDFTLDGDVQVVKTMYDLGYRKQKDGE